MKSIQVVEGWEVRSDQRPFTTSVSDNMEIRTTNQREVGHLNDPVKVGFLRAASETVRLMIRGVGPTPSSSMSCMLCATVRHNIISII